MPKAKMNDLLKQRMAATQQVSELQMGEAAYEKLFAPTGQTPTFNLGRMPKANLAELPMDKLVTFFTADIGFKPYSPEKLKAFAQQLAENGLLERIIVRPIPGTDTYEILAGHNRVAAGRLNAWQTIPAEIVEVNDDRAITIATVTNLMRRQDLSIIERGKAYRALLEAKRKQGYRSDITSGDNRQKFLAREVVAQFFGVTEYEIRKAIKLTMLIPALQDILIDTPKHLNLVCAEIIADYDSQSQEAFVEICSIDGYVLNKSAMQHIRNQCPPPTADRQAVFAAWREARARAEQRLAAPPKKISFNRKPFAPYLERLGSDKEIEALFLEFLREKVVLQ